MASVDMPADVPVMRPPRATTGPIAWLRDNLFSSVFNSALTVVGLYLIFRLVYAALDWAVFDAVFTGADGSACSGAKTGAPPIGADVQFGDVEGAFGFPEVDP